MKRKGVIFRPAPHLTYRQPLPGELNGNGHPIPQGYCIIVKVSDCLDDAGVFRIQKCKTAKAHGLQIHGRSNHIYGRTWRRCNTRRWFPVRVGPTLTPTQYKTAEMGGNLNPERWVRRNYDFYWTSSTYWVEDGKVYRGILYRHTDPVSGEDASFSQEIEG